MTREVRLGLAGIAVLAVLGWVVTLYLGGTFKNTYAVDALFQRAGQNLRGGSDVKLRGVLVGTVKSIDVADDGTARVSMAMLPGHEIPRDVTASIRAKTLFGEKFVDLHIPDAPSGERLRAGDVIGMDRTVPPFEVETILTKAVPLLDAVDPERLGAAFQALAQALVGNEQALRAATTQGATTLTETERTLPQLERDLQHLERLGSALDRSDDDLVAALASLQKAGEPVAANRAQLEAVLASLTALSRDLADLSEAHRADLETLSGEGAAVLRTVAARANELPALLDALDGFLGVWISDLTRPDGGPEGRWRIELTTLPGTGTPYAPGTEPKPASADRASLLRQLVKQAPATPAGRLADVLYAPVPAETLLELVERLPKVRPE